jgi:hypothetical protein
LAETVQLLESETDVRVGKDTLRRFEAGVGSPHDPLLPVALDHVLGAEGHLANVEVASGRGSGTVMLPPFWHGPTWMDLKALEVDEPATTTPRSAQDSKADPNRVNLQWGNWHRRLDGPFPLLAVSHAPLRPLRIEAAASIGWRIGVGRPAGAYPINHRWYPDSLATAQGALATYRQRFDDALRHAAENPR